jgi:hypothetical protein
MAGSRSRQCSWPLTPRCGLAAKRLKTTMKMIGMLLAYLA